MLSENADLADLNTSKKGMLFPVWGKKKKKLLETLNFTCLFQPKGKHCYKAW